RNIGLYHWHRLAEELHINPDAMIQRVDEFARQLADHVPDIRRRMTEEGLTHPVIARLADELTARAAARRAIFHHVLKTILILSIALIASRRNRTMNPPSPDEFRKGYMAFQQQKRRHVQ